MVRFYNCTQPFLTYYICLWVGLIMLYFWVHHAFVLGLMVGLLASTFNTIIFEYYLHRAKQTRVGSVSTGGNWRYFIAILACATWVAFQEQIHIIGVLIGLMVSYVLMIFRPLIKKDTRNSN
ncbi:ATP synthase protein I2 [Staphylococcus agnetis]|uniref:ATP synthase subunit I n=1 Tax=Staphylococcus agnetis TaxID=985762 RepID=UPI000DFBC2A9|nr:ATP synthase subunit I [Staphylococcus agnetis]SUK11698.1 ATP synthase protein I2 [Staphylococcus agnetis]